MARILVLDDDPRIRKLVVRIVGRLGHQVEEAHTLQEAVESFWDRTPDLLVTDYHLPGADGVRAITTLRGLHPQLRVLMISGSVAEGGVERLRSVAGADRALAKPFEVSDLRDAVSALLEMPAGRGAISRSS